MFPIKVKKSLHEVDDRAKNTRVLIRNGIIAIIILAIFITPYVINFEFYVEEDTPAGNLDQFLDVTKEAGEPVVSDNALTQTTDPSPTGGSQDGTTTGSPENSGNTDAAVTNPDGSTVGTGSGTTASAPPVANGDATVPAAEDTASTEQSAAEAGEDRISKKEKTKAEKRKEVVTTEILGTKIDQRLGQQNPGKSCVVFYAEDPEVVKDVVSTKVRKTM